MLELKGIEWTLPGGEEILRGIDFTVPDGKMTVITGPNGGGKTSIAKIIAGIASPTRGTDSAGWRRHHRLGYHQTFP